jgi:hypothetical protein
VRRVRYLPEEGGARVPGTGDESSGWREGEESTVST